MWNEVWIISEWDRWFGGACSATINMETYASALHRRAE